jgi:tetratricopeptide (TPR) repeat protein
LSLASQRGAHLNDPGAELLDRVSGFWSRSGRYVLAGVGTVAAIGLIAFFTLRARAAAEEQAAGRLAEANIYFWQGDYTRSLTMARQISEQFGSTPSGVDALRLAGDDAFWNGDFKGATEHYRRYLDRVKRGAIHDAVRRSYAYALESDRQFRPAAEAYESLVGAFDRESSAECLTSAARCYRNLGQTADAAKRLQRVLDEFGETSYANAARTHLGELTGGSS